MNKNIKLILSTVSLCVAIVAVAVVAFAWLSLNNKTDSTGMTMDIETNGNMLIKKVGGTTYASSVTWSDSAKKYIPCTHADTVTVDSASKNTTNGLAYNTTPSGIASDTGLGTVTLADAVNGTPSSALYYIDYEVYIASESYAISTTGLTIALSLDSSTTLSNDAYKALSIDFYTVSGTTNTYQNTLNLAGVKKDTTGGGDAADKLTSFTISSITSIPMAVSGDDSGSIHILMRCYFDGALLQSTTKAYVNSAVLTTTSAIKFNVSFTAEGAQNVPGTKTA